MKDLTRVRVVASGVVQGVGYRFFAMRLARANGVTGWVRNREDGAVELEAEADETVIESLLKDLRIGPPSAEVSRLDVERIAPTGRDRGFDVRF